MECLCQKGFLGATKHLYNWLCPLVCRSVGLSVTHSFDDQHVAPYWPTWPCFLLLKRKKEILGFGGNNGRGIRVEDTFIQTAFFYFFLLDHLLRLKRYHSFSRLSSASMRGRLRWSVCRKEGRCCDDLDERVLRLLPSHKTAPQTHILPLFTRITAPADP